ncbi:MAG: ribosomal protein L37AE/L43A, partial [Polaribacter sp.]
ATSFFTVSSSKFVKNEQICIENKVKKIERKARLGPECFQDKVTPKKLKIWFCNQIKPHRL